VEQQIHSNKSETMQATVNSGHVKVQNMRDERTAILLTNVAVLIFHKLMVKSSQTLHLLFGLFENRYLPRAGARPPCTVTHHCTTFCTVSRICRKRSLWDQWTCNCFCRFMVQSQIAQSRVSKRFARGLSKLLHNSSWAGNLT